MDVGQISKAVWMWCEHWRIVSGDLALLSKTLRFFPSIWRRSLQRRCPLTHIVPDLKVIMWLWYVLNVGTVYRHWHLVIYYNIYIYILYCMWCAMHTYPWENASVWAIFILHSTRLNAAGATDLQSDLTAIKTWLLLLRDLFSHYCQRTQHPKARYTCISSTCIAK